MYYITAWVEINRRPIKCWYDINDNWITQYNSDFSNVEYFMTLDDAQERAADIIDRIKGSGSKKILSVFINNERSRKRIAVYKRSKKK